jgi:hypothetical protein
MKPNRHERRAANALSRKQLTITAIHEAGHAVGRYLTADIMGHSVEDAISWIEVGLDAMPCASRDYSAMLSSMATTYGPMYSRPMIDLLISSPSHDPADAVEADVSRCIAAGIDVIAWAKAKALICMFGPVAEAIYTRREIATVVNSYECESDLNDAMFGCWLAKMSAEDVSTAVNVAVEIAARKLADPKVWRAVQRLANNLPAQGRLEGPRAAEIIGQALGL